MLVELQRQDVSTLKESPFCPLPEDSRRLKYREVARRKQRLALDGRASEAYYKELLLLSQARSDLAAEKDRKQVDKDIPRTFHCLPPTQGTHGAEALQPLVRRIILAYIERGRAVCVSSGVEVQQGSTGCAATTARGMLAGYPQGLNFLAGMCILCVGGDVWDGSTLLALEENGFWLLAFLLEDVLDPDFFGADVKPNLQMAYIGGLGVKAMVLELAEERCIAMHGALGPEAFRNCCGTVLDRWVLSLFVGCVPTRLLQRFFDLLLLGGESMASTAPVHNGCEHRAPRGLVTFIAFTLAGLVLCGEHRFAFSDSLERLRRKRELGSSAEDLSLAAAEMIHGVQDELRKWAPDKDVSFFGAVSRLVGELSVGGHGADRLWQGVRRHKQRIADCAGNYDEQLRSLTQRTHFTVEEIRGLKRELDRLQQRQQRGSILGRRLCVWLPTAAGGAEKREEGLSLEAFTRIVEKTVPELPQELIGRLFKKLDAFGVGTLAFAELACGMSALSLGTMDEKLQVCFDMFDSQNQRALTLKDVCDLCTVLFRVALAHGLEDARRASTDDVLFTRSSRLGDVDENVSTDAPSSPSGSCKFASPRVESTVDIVNRISNLRNSGTSGTSTRHRCSLDSMLVQPVKVGRGSQASGSAPWRSMQLRLLAAAESRCPGGPLLVSFEDFRNAAMNEPALLGLFSWCLPRPPELLSTSYLVEPPIESRVADGCCGPCGRMAFLMGR